ncbi:S-adenosyl-L-methionine-dependent methyltransferase [Pseudoneurospora amorphoporcata]|uniref:S-adenosyl-L-methionine-dependent methyltransferase n=1 Tax=Pseudoneurospora amorphoporcata TaxID=241081 RepID=A0AAN6SC24_9PEZI|nr:S-adenosyl-L-methionine-dependent methyltransferase [Pseudoneurospora amorphoporcata]
MSSPVNGKAQSPAPQSPGLQSQQKAKTPEPTSPPSAKSPTPGPASPQSPQSPEAAVASDPSSGALPGIHWTQQGLPTVDNDTDSTLGSDIESSTASISSSILNYRTLNGRTYHSDSVANNEYWAPNDPKHIEALEVLYHALELARGGLHLAPLEDDIQNAVDIGTGSGLWAIDFADRYPNCNVVGTDISPIQPSWVPPNLRFEIDDATKEWTFKEDFFDFIHIMFLNGCCGNWADIYKEAYRCCKPGGWIEHYDVSPLVLSDDGTVLEGSAMDQYGKVFREAGKKVGIDTCTADNGTMENGIKEAGFVNVQVKDIKLPISPWPKDPKMKEIGLYTYATMTTDVEGLVQFMYTNVMGWSKEEVTVYAAHMRQELKNMKIHGYFNWKVVYAQKPE